MSRDIVVGIATSYGIESRWRWNFPHPPIPPWGPPILP